MLVDGPAGEQRLLLAIHHLVVDGVSWRVLLEDLQQVYRQLDEGAEPALPAKTSAFRDWAGRLQAYAGSESLREELGWWQARLGGQSAEWPCDRPQGDNREALAESVSLRLDPQRTRQLLQQAPAAYRTQVNDLLLTALARVLCRWSGQPSTLVQLEGHGREALFDDIDLTRSVGWFTSAYPLRLTPAQSPGESIKAIKEQLRAVPHKGLGYGVLRYLADPAVRQAMAALPTAPITFNYLGQFDQSFADALFQPLDQPTGPIHDEQAPLPNELSVDGQVYGGELVLRWTYSRERYDAQTVNELAQAYLAELQALIEHCLEDGAGGLTPSDFPLAQLSQAQLDALAVPAGEIEDVYPLTPMQEGLLLHTSGADCRAFRRQPVRGWGTDVPHRRPGALPRDGVIEYAGRIDHQVKLRGLRIELGEIEARLLEHPWVREAAVLAVDGRQLVGYVVLESEGGDWREALAAHLAASLPEYMVPAQWLALERMPLSPNGKLDRKALPAPEVSVAQAGYSAPRNAVERTLAEIWQDLLGVERVGLDDNFFSLGGDSIVSIQVVSRARQAGLQLSPRDLFQHQNIRSLALAAKAGAATAEQGPASGEVALAPVQRWFFEQSIPNRQHWNQSLLLQARQPLDGDRLGRALERLQAQHDALRLRFREERGAWHQAYAEQAGEPLWRRQAGSEEALLALCEEAQRSLDLEQGPLLRALLVDMADGSQRLLLVIHHLAVDGVSWRILLEDLQ
ncbi:hypothetical protein ACS96_27925 [Pseudomonas aeruginosa]|nr:hypothetical protein ACS96_27925 [Pseudomonas aeruginosa]